MGKYIGLVSFRQEMSSICKKNVSNSHWIVKTFDFFVGLMQFLDNFREILFQVPTQSIKQQKTSYPLQCLKKTLQRFASNTLLKVSKFSNILVFVQLEYILNRVGVRMLATVQQRSLNF